MKESNRFGVTWGWVDDDWGWFNLCELFL